MLVDRILGAGAVLLAAPIAIAAWGYGVGSPKSPGAGFWPLVIAVVMTGLGLSLILRPAPKATTAHEESRWKQFSISLGTLFFYIAFLEPLGYLLATAALLFVQLRWVENHSWKSSCWISILAAVFSLVLFRVVLKVSLPAGLIPLPG